MRRPCEPNHGIRITTKTTTSIKIAVRQMMLGRQAACSVGISRHQSWNCTYHVHKYSCTSNRIDGPFLLYMNCLVVFWGRLIFGVDLYSGKCSLYTYIYTYKKVVCVCLLVCLSAFYRPHDICPFCGAASEYSESRRAGAVVASGPARAGKHAQREQARACRTTSQRKNRCADAFQKQNRTHARMLSYTYLPRFSKKGKKKLTCHFPSSVYSLHSLGVFTFRIVLNRT